MTDMFEVGDVVEIVCHDGAVFRGLLTDFTDDYIVVGGRGYPVDDIVVMRP